MLMVGLAPRAQYAMLSGTGTNAPLVHVCTDHVARLVTIPPRTARQGVVTTTGWALTVVPAPHILLDSTRIAPVAFQHTLAKCATNLVPAARTVSLTHLE